MSSNQIAFSYPPASLYGASGSRNRSLYGNNSLTDQPGVFSPFQEQLRSDVFVSQFPPSNNVGLSRPGASKPGWLGSFFKAGAGYVVGRQALQAVGVQQQPTGWLTHLGRVGALTAGIKVLGNYNPFARTSDDATPSTPDWLMSLLTFGSTLAGLLFLCKRFDFATLLNAPSSALSALRGFPVFSRLRQALSKLKEAPAAIAPNPLLS